MARLVTACNRSRHGMALLLVLLLVFVWRLTTAIPQPYVDQSQLADLKAKQAQLHHLP